MPRKVNLIQDTQPTSKQYKQHNSYFVHTLRDRLLSRVSFTVGGNALDRYYQDDIDVLLRKSRIKIE